MARDLADRAIDYAENSGEVWYLPEYYRVKGDLLRLSSESGQYTEAALSSYRKAHSLAAEAGARGWQLRAALSLAQHCIDDTEAAQAYGLRERAYETFSEGFNTPDLKQAKELLDTPR